MIIQRSKENNRERGAVSLFIVIFTTLLITIVTISFVQLMVSDQRQATYSDLSESAYDSAQAGIEDAKRALLINQDCRGKSTSQCKDVQAAIDAGQCNTLSAIFGNPNDTETKIQQTAGDNKLDQAYTCVKIQSDTPDFLGSVDPGLSPVLVPLRGTDTVSKIIVSWGLNKNGGPVDLPASGSISLPKVGTSWPASRPALLRVQLIDGKDNFRLSDFDKNGYSDTVFLYPSRIGGTSASFVADSRRTTPLGNKPQPIKCSSAVNSGAYSCQVTLDLTSAIKAGSQTAFLSLGAFYNATDFKVELMKGNEGNAVSFDSVQPEIDSTGRANDLFRRVVSRVEMGGSFNYPQAAIETTGKLCKDFSVTTEPSDYSNRCTP
jgi:hypothetical protein